MYLITVTLCLPALSAAGQEPAIPARHDAQKPPPAPGRQARQPKINPGHGPILPGARQLLPPHIEDAELAALLAGLKLE
jgi:hypothetical protein